MMKNAESHHLNPLVILHITRSGSFRKYVFTKCPNRKYMVPPMKYFLPKE